jgi:hypothetical protein
MSKPRRDRALAPSIPALTPESIDSLQPETKITALEYYIRGFGLSRKKQSDTIRGLNAKVRTLETELLLCQRDNATLRSLLVPMLPPGEKR